MDNMQNVQEEIIVGKSKKSRKLMNLGIISATLVAVIILNIILGILIYKNVAYIDLTQPKYTDMSGFYTYTDTLDEVMQKNVIPEIDAINAERVKDGLDELKVEIIFCRDSDLLESDDDSRQVHHTARQLQSHFSKYIEIKYADVATNPSSVQDYTITSATQIYPTDVIISFGTEFNVHGLISFFTLDTDTGEVWAYNGEKKFAATILSLTRADSPVCAITYNHGEQLFDFSSGEAKIRDEYSAFIKIIEGAGYNVELIDLEKEEIPENCRMIVCFAPTSDFKAYGNLGESGISEIEKLDRYLDDAHSFFYICNSSSPELQNLEEYLSEWGIKPSRVTTASGIDKNYSLSDTSNCTDKDGNYIIGKYETVGYGASVTADLRALSFAPNIAFGNATAILPSDSYSRSVILPESSGGDRTVIYNYYNNGVIRTMYNIFTTYDSAFATVDGNVYEYASENNLFKLFTLTEETNQVQEDSFTLANLSSYVLALSSSDFLKNEFLESSSYGNADALLAALRATSTETVPVNIPFKAYYDYTIDDTAYSYKNTTTFKILSYVCIALPTVAIATVGIVVCAKRKYL